MHQAEQLPVMVLQVVNSSRPTASAQLLQAEEAVETTWVQLLSVAEVAKTTPARVCSEEAWLQLFGVDWQALLEMSRVVGSREMKTMTMVSTLALVALVA